MNLQKKSFALEPNCLAGKIVLLTGATGDLGSEVAKELTNFGAEVILLGRNKKKLEALYDELLEIGPEGAIYVTDLLKMGIKEVEDLKAHIQNLFGRLDAIVFCTGKWGTLTPIEHYPEHQWLEIMHLNLNVPFLLIKNLLPLLKQSAQGTLVLTESPLAFEAKAFHGAFNCAQFGLRALIEMLQQELEHTSVQVKGFNPQVFQSKLRRLLFPGDLNEYPEPSAIAPHYVEMLCG